MRRDAQPLWPYPRTMMDVNRLIRTAVWPLKRDIEGPIPGKYFDLKNPHPDVLIIDDVAEVQIRIGLDIDNVCADMTGGIFREAVNRKLIREVPDNYRDLEWIDTDAQFSPIWTELAHTVWNDLEFIGGLEPMKPPPFTPIAYISARSCPTHVTYDWLSKHGFPLSRIEHTHNECKAEAVTRNRINVFVDDHPRHYEALESIGVVCLLVDHGYNRHLDAVGWKRISSLDDIPALMPRIQEELIARQ